MRYSTNEQLTTDIDLAGKPIYQITYHDRIIPSGGRVLLANRPAEIENFIQAYGNLLWNGYSYQIGYCNATASPTSGIGIYANSSQINMLLTADFNSEIEYWVTVQYTKTTDTPVTTGADAAAPQKAQAIKTVKKAAKTATK